MNSREVGVVRSQVRDKYKVPGHIDYDKRAVNAVYFRSGSVLHEISKALGALMLSRWGEVVFNDRMRRCLFELDHTVNEAFRGCGVDPCYFITEAQECSRSFDIPTGTVNPTRDLVDLDSGVRYEFETEPEMAVRHKGDRSVIVVMV